MTQSFLAILFLALAATSVTVTLSRAPIFNRPRNWVAGKSEFLKKLISCPYCLSHWVSFAIVGLYRPTVLPVHPVVNYFMVSFAIVTVASMLTGLIFTAFQHIPPPQEAVEEEEAEET